MLLVVLLFKQAVGGARHTFRVKGVRSEGRSVSRTMISASPRCTMRNASPIACTPVAHAVEVAWLGPFRLCLQVCHARSLWGLCQHEH